MQGISVHPFVDITITDEPMAVATLRFSSHFTPKKFGKGLTPQAQPKSSNGWKALLWFNILRVEFCETSGYSCEHLEELYFHDSQYIWQLYWYSYLQRSYPKICLLVEAIRKRCLPVTRDKPCLLSKLW